MGENVYLPEIFRVEDVKIINSHSYDLTINIDKNVKPGQFFMFAIPNYKEVPVFASDILKGQVSLRVKRPSKIKEEVFSESKGRYFYIRGPYGNGIDFPEDKEKMIIVFEQKGIPETKNAVKFYQGKDIELELIYFSKESTEEFEEVKNKTYLENFDLSIISKTQIKDPKKTSVIICLKDSEMKLAAEEFIKKGIDEEDIIIIKNHNLICGFGKCGHCRTGHIHACTDGPVFRYSQIKTLID